MEVIGGERERRQERCRAEDGGGRRGRVVSSGRVKRGREHVERVKLATTRRGNEVSNLSSHLTAFTQ